MSKSTQKCACFFAILAGFGREIYWGHDASRILTRKPPGRDFFLK
jgi:hypothetical protein